jgi:hypothetical protein
MNALMAISQWHKFRHPTDAIAVALAYLKESADVFHIKTDNLVYIDDYASSYRDKCSASGG